MKKLLLPKTELNEVLLSFKKAFYSAGIFSMFINMLGLIPSIYMLQVYDRVLQSRNETTLMMLTVILLGFYAMLGMLEYARSKLLVRVGAQIDQKLSERIFTASFESYLRRSGGNAGQALGDLTNVRQFITGNGLFAFFDAPWAPFYLAVIFMFSPWLGLFAVIAMVILGILAWATEVTTRKPLAEASMYASAANTFAANNLRNAEVIEAMGMLQPIHRRWMARQREFLGLQAQASDQAAAFQATSKFVQTTMASLLLGVGAWLILENALPGGGGAMIVGSVLGGRMLAPLVQTISQWRAVVNLRDAWGRLDQLLTQLPARPPAMSLPPPKGRLQLENLMAAAPSSNAPILKGLAFALQPGEVLAVVGPSASGKTTLARLLVGLWPAAGGKVRLDGVDIFAWDKLELGPCLGYLPQGVELLEGTLAENIARFGTPSPAKLEAAARAVGLHDFILSLPQGYDSPVGRDGAMLSGGQRQRIALARALYGDPVFVVLDEPNSSLDEAGDLALAQAIAQLKARGTTFVVMTHRTSVLGVADKLLVLRDGMQQAFGPRDEVLAALAKAAQQAQQQAQQVHRPHAPQAGPKMAAPAP